MNGRAAHPDGPTRLAGTNGAQHGGRPLVLWADDDANMRTYVQRLLAPSYDVCAVADGRAALAEALARPPDLVLSDIMMPRMDGVALLRELRRDPRTSRIPVILVSARAGEDSRVEGLETGADDYLVKPFSPRELLARVGARIELARVRHESEQRVTRILESITDAFQVIDADWRLAYMNPVARRVFAAHGHDPDAMIGKHFWDELFPQARHSAAAVHMFRAMRDRVPVSFEAYYPPWDSWLLCRFDPLPDGGLANYFQDVTERKRAEDALRLSEERLAADLAAMTRLQDVSTRLVQAGDSTRLLLEIVDTAIAVTAADMGNIQLFDPASGELRIVASRGLKRPFLEFFDRIGDGQGCCGVAMRQRRRAIIEDVATSELLAGTPALEVMRAAGVRSVQSTPLLDRSGRLVGMLSTHYRTMRQPAERDLRILDLLAREAADWIERTRADEALRASEERMRRYFELGLIGMAITSPTKGCIEVNDRLCEILGYTRDELMGITWPELTHPDDLAADLALFRRVLNREIDGYAIDKRWIRKDGRVVHSSISVKCVRRPDGSVDYFVALLQDVTLRKRAEEALRASEERYRSLISQVRDYAIFTTDEAGIVTSWNEGCQQVLGYSQDEFLGLDSRALLTPEDVSADVPARLRDAAEDGSTRNDGWMLAKGGRRFYAMGATAGLRDSSGRPIGYSTVIRDVTQMKLSHDAIADHGESLERLVTERTDQLATTIERLRLSERMASLGTLSAGLGHDMGNLLLPLDVRIQLLLRADLSPELREHVLGIQKSAEYLQRLSNSLRLLATDPSSARQGETTEIGAWWSDVGLMLRNVLPRGVRLERDLPPAACWVAIGRAALTQAVFNVMQNAGDALQERGEGRVLLAVTQDRDADGVVLAVTDDGPGMPREVLRRCMEPYFSTKARGLATGMGLALVHGLIGDAGGSVEIDSTVGSGTTVRLALPRAPASDRTESRRRCPAVVEVRDARMRAFMRGELRGLGFDVRKRLSDDGAPCLVVAEPVAVPALLSRLGTRETYIIVAGELAPPEVPVSAELVVLGADPEPDAIRHALRDGAGWVDTVEA